ncbi:LuxR C-terminal-related transcriptional regulator [Kosakonia sp. H02]|nr:LuxR C-terminal-related transcriptional regulator [Kosakonia sp. H02]
MLSPGGNHGIIISQAPVLRAGIGSIFERHFPEYELTYYSTVEEIALSQLACARLIIIDLTGELRFAQKRCEQYYSLISQYDKARWLFFISPELYPDAVDFLLQPQTILLSHIEPVEGVINAVREGYEDVEKVSETLLFATQNREEETLSTHKILTFSERKVLRLLGKGWGINQIAMLLKKSNKTVSAQKNSAMRRLSLRSNADLYTWINSHQGMKELNLGSAHGDHNEWKKLAKQETLPS